MSQSILIKKLAKFLAHDAEHHIRSLKADLAKADSKQAEKIKKQIEESNSYKIKIVHCLEESRGVCFALSVCHGMMELAGKLNWWEQGLVDLANWDDPTLLDTELKLPDALESKLSHALSRRRFYERVLNYVISLQRVSSDENSSIQQQIYSQAFSAFFPGKMDYVSQSELLEPGKHIIDIPGPSPHQIKRSYIELSLNDQIADIKAIDQIAGFLNNDMLEYLLDEKMFEGRLCIVYSSYLINKNVIPSSYLIYNHGVKLSYNKITSQWMLYDPNDDHTSLDSIHFTGTKEKVIQRIKSKFGNELSLTICSTNEEKSLHFPSLSDFKSPSTLVENLGLITMIIHTPKLARDYLKMAEKDDQMCDAVFEAFNCQDGLTKRDFNVLTEQSVIQIIVNSLDENTLLPFIKIAATDSKKASQLCKALLKQNKNFENGFTTIFQQCPACLKELIHLAKINITILQGLLESLNNYLLLEIKANEYDPFSSLFQFMESKQCDPDTHKTFSRLIHQKKDLIIKHYPEYSSYIMKLKNPDLDKLRELVHLASESKENLEKLAKELQAGDFKQNDLLLIIKNDGDLLNQLISFVEKGKDTKGMAAIIKNLHKAIDAIAMHQPIQLFRLFKFVATNSDECLNIFSAILAIDDDKNGLINILRSIANSNSENETGWSIFLKHSENSFREKLIQNLTIRIQTLNSSELLEIGNLVRLALYQSGTPLRGICKERHSFRGKDSYGKTNLWQSLLKEIQAALQKIGVDGELKADGNDKLVQAILSEKIKR